MVKPNTGLTGVSQNLVPNGGNFQWALQGQGTGEQVFSITNLDTVNTVDLIQLQPTLDNDFIDLGDNVLPGPVIIPPGSTVWVDGNFDGLAGIFVEVGNTSGADVLVRFRWNSGATAANPSGFLSINGREVVLPPTPPTYVYRFAAGYQPPASAPAAAVAYSSNGGVPTPVPLDYPIPPTPTTQVNLSVNVTLNSLAAPLVVQAQDGITPIGDAVTIGPGATGAFQITAPGTVTVGLNLAMTSKEAVGINTMQLCAAITLS